MSTSFAAFKKAEMDRYYARQRERESAKSKASWSQVIAAMNSKTLPKSDNAEHPDPHGWKKVIAKMNGR